MSSASRSPGGPNANARANPLPMLNYGNQAGGGTVHYGAVSWRFHEDDFRARSHTIERYGAAAIPRGFLARRLAAELRRSRAVLRPRRIRARRVGQGRQSAGQARSTAATCSKRRAAATIRCRRCATINRASFFDGAAEKLGYHPFSTPRAILSQAYNGRPGCTYCGFCQAFGCHVGAKSSILVTKLPEADATGNFKLVTGAMCYRVNSDNSGRVTGVSYYGPDGSDNTIEAELVILSPVHLRQHAPAAAVEDGQVSQRPRQFERPGRASTSWPT